MGSIDTPSRWEKWVDEELTEEMPTRQPMTASERHEWMAEYCDLWQQKDGGYEVTDVLGQKTWDADFGEALEIAAARFYAANE